jgi:hypothetical protein
MSINEKALLVKMSISQWYSHKSDARIAEEVAIQHNVAGKKFNNKYIKHILSNIALGAIQAVISDLRTYHNEKTMPWKENGARILPAASFMDYQKHVAILRTNFEQEVKRFAAKYPDWVMQARADMGSLFSELDYPTADEIKDKFSLEVSVMPFPSEADFRVDVDNTVMDELRAQTAQQIRTALQEATNSVRLRVLERVKLLHTALSDPKRVFRDETFHAVRNVAEDARQLNLTSDMDLTMLVNKTDFLNNYTPNMLRSPATLNRASVAYQLQEILLGYPS